MKSLISLSILCIALLMHPPHTIHLKDSSCNTLSAEITPYVNGEVILKLKCSIMEDLLSEILSTHSLMKICRVDTLENVYKVNLPDGVDPVEISKRWEENPFVEWAEPNYIYRIDTKPNDKAFSLQWALSRICAPDAWSIETGDPDVTIAVIDTGIDYDHPDLESNIWTNPREDLDGIDNDGNGYVDDIHGWDFVENDNDPFDDNGHGTHCAGIIGAVGNNGIGISGLCWRCKIMPIKCFNSLGYGDALNISRGIRYAVDNGADVISMSWGSTIPSNLIRDAIEEAHERGVILVAAAGNYNSTMKVYPAAYKDVIAVAATDKNDKRANFSEYGYWIDVSAPGVDIYSTLPNDNYGYGKGTSMACPFVASLAALIKSKYKDATNEQVESIINSAVDRVNSKVYIGTGRINASKALRLYPTTAKIYSPCAGDVVRGDIIAIVGTAERNYTLSYGKGIYPTNWTTFYVSDQPVYRDILAYWNITSLDPGIYTLRLRVYQNADAYVEDMVPIKIRSCTLHVGGEGLGNYTSVQDAVIEATDGDTILIHIGTYRGSIIIDKNITIAGEDRNKTFIKGGAWGVLATSSSCSVKNITIMESGIGILTIDQCTSFRVNDCNVANCYIGIYFVGENSSIENSTISNNLIGIVLDALCYSSLKNNRIVNNSYSGVELMSCSGNRFEGNRIESNAYGIFIVPNGDVNCNCSINEPFNFETGFAESSDYADIRWRKIDGNTIIITTVKALGLSIINKSYEDLTLANLSDLTNDITLKFPFNGTIICLTKEYHYVKMRINSLDGNSMNFTYSFFIQNGSANNKFYSNYVVDNYYGITAGNSFSNIIYNNCFSNRINALGFGRNLWNVSKEKEENIVGGSHIGGNYWNDYEGEDIDGDGIGDSNLPYNSRGFILNGGDELPLVARAYNVNQGRWYCSLRSAFDNASEGDVIRVCFDLYRGSIVISKGIRLIGSATIDGCGGCGVRINANNAYLENFTILNASIGVYVNGSSAVKKCFIHDCTNGILVDSSENFDISWNIITNNLCGICIDGSSNGEIHHNKVSGNIRGVLLNFSFNNTLWRNMIEMNEWGLILGGTSSNNTIYDNYFSDNACNAQEHGFNRWNISKTMGKNVVGGPYLGGNFWKDYEGIDGDHDGLGDEPYHRDGMTCKDFHPLVISPSVTYVSPKGSKVSVSSKIVVRFSKPMNESSVEKNFVVVPSVEGTFLWKNDGRELSFEPSNLKYNTKYSVTVTWNAMDRYGNVLLENFSWFFVTEKGYQNGYGNAYLPTPNRPPNPPSRPSGPSKGYTNTSYTFCTFSTDPDGDAIFYIFDWGDGTITEIKGGFPSGEKVTASHSWSLPGIYNIKAKAIDTFGHSSAWSETANITIEDIGMLKRPVAVIKVLGRALTGKNITFDASSSYDPDGTIKNYTWFFGDGNKGYGKIVNHTYTLPGNYKVALTVKDDDGLTNTSIKNIVILLDSDGDGWSDADEERCGTDPFDLNDHPTDGDGDGIPNSIDLDDDNDGLGDFMEALIGSNPNERNSYIMLIIKGKLTYLVDVDRDGYFDTFFDPEKMKKTGVVVSGSKYLIDTNGDGKADYLYNPLSGKVNLLKVTSHSHLWCAILIIIAISLFTLILLKRKII